MPLALLRWAIRKYGFWYKLLIIRALKFYYGGADKIPKPIVDRLVPDWAVDVIQRVALIGNFGKSMGAIDTDIFQQIAGVMQGRLHSERDALLVERILFSKNPVKAFLAYLIINDQLTHGMRYRLYVNFHIVKSQIAAANR